LFRTLASCGAAPSITRRQAEPDGIQTRVDPDHGVDLIFREFGLHQKEKLAIVGTLGGPSSMTDLKEDACGERLRNRCCLAKVSPHGEKQHTGEHRRAAAGHHQSGRIELHCGAGFRSGMQE
jgi:hypothetical protein